MYLPVNVTARSYRPAKTARQPSRPLSDALPHGQAGLSTAAVQRKSACACGGACPRCRADGELAETPALQAKLKIGAPDDRYEQEADRVADQVMRMPEPQGQIGEEEEEAVQTKPLGSQVTPLVQRQADEEEEEQLQTKRRCDSGQKTPAAGFEEGLQQLRGGGEPMTDSLRSYFEPRFGRDLGGVRLHHSEPAATAAQQVNARAFTVGRDVVFGAGQYSPDSHDGRSLLAHELTHVLQQTGGAEAEPRVQRVVQIRPPGRGEISKR